MELIYALDIIELISALDLVKLISGLNLLEKIMHCYSTKGTLSQFVTEQIVVDNRGTSYTC